MSEGGYLPPAGTGGADSPLPAGYGALDEGYAPVDRRRGARRPRPAAAPGADQGVPSPRAVAAAGGVVAAALAPDPLEARPVRERPRSRDADIEEGPVHGTRHPVQRVQVVRGLRSRRLVRRVDVWTVCKVSFVFYLLALVSMDVAGLVMWKVATTFGFIHTIEKSIRTLFSLKSFTLHPGTTFAYSTAIAAVVCLFGVVLNVLAALTYNLISDVVGGVQVIVVTEED